MARWALSQSAAEDLEQLVATYHCNPSMVLN